MKGLRQLQRFFADYDVHRLMVGDTFMGIWRDTSANAFSIKRITERFSG